LEDQLQKYQKLELTNQEKIATLIKGFEESKAGLKDQIDNVNDTLKVQISFFFSS
jgi:hypothetical protein